MSANHDQQQRSSNQQRFVALCEARATLWQLNFFRDIPELADALQATATDWGLIEQIGQDAVQAIMAAAVQEVRDDL